MFFTEPYNVCVTFNDEKYLFKDVFRCGMVYVDGSFVFIVRSRYKNKDYIDKFRLDDVNQISNVDYWRNEGGGNK